MVTRNKKIEKELSSFMILFFQLAVNGMNICFVLGCFSVLCGVIVYLCSSGFSSLTSRFSIPGASVIVITL